MMEDDISLEYCSVVIGPLSSHLAGLNGPEQRIFVGVHIEQFTYFVADRDNFWLW